MRTLVLIALAGVMLAAEAAGQPSPAPSTRPAAKSTPATKRPAAPALPMSVEELLRKSKDPLRRESAALVLGVRGSPAALPLLREALAKDPNKWVRTRAAEALGLIGDPAAIPWLHNALSSEKEPRVRRTIGEALVRLGQNAGVKELVWQMQSGNNNTKAEAMLFLVGATGQPLGQDSKAWWDYFNEKSGGVTLARRPSGSPAVMPLRGVPSGAVSRAPITGPFLYSRKPFTWRHVPAVVLELEPRREPVSRASLEQYEKKRGRIPNGCLLLIRTGWRDAKSPAPEPDKVGDTKAPRPMRPVSELPVPYLEPDAVAFLLQRAPKLIGVGMDTPALDSSPDKAHPARDALLAADRIAVAAVGDMDRLVSNGTRLILFPTAGGPGVTILAILP